MSQWSDGVVFANGINHHYYRTGGDKPALVLLHGFTDGGLCWTPIAKALATEYDVIMIDARGHGRSDISTSKFTTELLASDVLAVIQTLGLGQVSLLGHSMGAHVAAHLAERHPEIARSLLLEDPPWTGINMPAESSEEDRDKRMALWEGQLRAFQQLSLEERIEEATYDHPRWSQDEIIPWAEAQGQFHAEIFSNGFAQLTSDWQVIVTHLTLPVLLLTGDPARGSIVTPEVAQLALHSWSDGTLAHIEGAGHNIRREQYNAYITTVHTFLTEK
jgi:pimeloyl-ACP methyl ester carboxylesterase